MCCTGSSQLVVVCLVEPGIFRDVHSLLQSSAEGLGRLEVVALAATGDEGAVGAGLVAGIDGISLGEGPQRMAAPAEADARCVGWWICWIDACI